MAEFKVDDNGNVTFNFNVNELTLADIAENVGGRCAPHKPDLLGFVDLIAHLVERKPSNYCLKSGKYLKQMGLHKFKVRSSNWDPMEVYAKDKDAALRYLSHLKGTSATEDKKWFNEDN